MKYTVLPSTGRRILSFADRGGVEEVESEIPEFIDTLKADQLVEDRRIRHAGRWISAKNLTFFTKESYNGAGKPPGGRVMAARGTALTSIALVLTALSGFSLSAPCYAATCETVVKHLNAKLHQEIDGAELVEILRTLNATDNRELPHKFITKKDALKAGWKPGKPLWSVNTLKGKSMGGDRFRNYDRKLPDRNHKWREADLDYQGGHRGPKRVVFSQNGRRMVTVDHYRTFTEVPPCR